VPIVEQNRHLPAEPGGGKHQVNGMIAVNVARFDEQTTPGRDHAQEMRTTCRQANANPIACLRGFGLSRLNGHQIGTIISIEIGNRKRESRSIVQRRRLPNVWLRRAERRSAGKQNAQ
jgi:hypothetical protein